MMLLLNTTSVFAVTNAELFTYAQANYPSTFSGTVEAGVYQQYTYNYFQGTNNYLAVDNNAKIFMLGPFTNNIVSEVGSVADYQNALRRFIGAVSQPCVQSDLTGTWAATASGTNSSLVESCSLTINGNGVVTSGSCFDIKTKTQYPISSANATITSQCSIQVNLYYQNGAVSVASGSISRGRDTIIGSFTNNFGDFGTFSAVRY